VLGLPFTFRLFFACSSHRQLETKTILTKQEEGSLVNGATTRLLDEVWRWTLDVEGGTPRYKHGLAILTACLLNYVSVTVHLMAIQLHLCQYGDRNTSDLGAG
jgi:hypothetical protein